MQHFGRFGSKSALAVHRANVANCRVALRVAERFHRPSSNGPARAAEAARTPHRRRWAGRNRPTFQPCLRRARSRSHAMETSRADPRFASWTIENSLAKARFNSWTIETCLAEALLHSWTFPPAIATLIFCSVLRSAAGGSRNELSWFFGP